MVKAHPLFRRRLAVDAHVKVAAEQLITEHGNHLRPDVVGKIFAPINHNYLYGVSKQTIVEQITHLVKREGKSLETIWKEQSWINPKNREDARTLSVMGMDRDKWAVKFSEILMIDIKENYDALNKSLLLVTPLELMLFYWVFGTNWKLLGKILIAGVAVSEASHLYKPNKGLSMIEFLLIGIIMQHLYNTRKLFSLPALVASAAALFPLYADPPAKGQWSTMTGKNHTAHDIHYVSMFAGILLKWFKIL